MTILYSLLLCLALGLTQWLIGGTRLLFSLPGYGLIALMGVLTVFSIRQRKPLPNRACLLASAIFFAYVLVRALTSPVVYLAWPDLFMVQAGLIIYLTTACYLTDPGRRLWVLGWLLALALLNVGVGVRQFVSGDGFMPSGLGGSPQYLGRASGLYICPDHLAGYLEVVTMLLLSAIFWGRSRQWVKLLMIYSVLCCLVGMVLTGSRGGFLSLCAGLATLAVLSLMRVRSGVPQLFPRAVIGTVLLVLLVSGAGWYGISQSRNLRWRAANLISNDVRFRVWPSAIKEWSLSPVVGTGSATFLYYGRRFRDPTVQQDPINTHNDYLQFLAEYGAVGIAGLLVFLAAHFRWGWITYRYLSLRGEAQGSRARKGSNAAAWNIGALSAVVAIAAHSVVDFNLHIPVNTLLLAFIFGVLANPGREVSGGREDADNRLTWIDFLPRFVLPALSVWLAVAGLPHLPGEYDAEQARKSLRDGRNLLGLNFATEGLRHESLNPMLYYYQGEARQALADGIPNTEVSRSFREGSVEPYEEGLRLAPMEDRLMLRLGAALTMLDRFDEAEPLLKRALLWDPSVPVTHTYYGSYLRRRGLLPQAEAAFRDALKIAPDSNASRGLEQIAGGAMAGALNN